jgi:hypothetical protein
MQSLTIPNPTLTQTLDLSTRKDQLNKSFTYVSSKPFHPGWNKIPGIQVEDGLITITPRNYFTKFEDPVWDYVPWDIVQAHWDEISETPEFVLEQVCLNFIRKQKRTTDDPRLILKNAEQVYSYIYNEERIFATPDLSEMVTSQDIQILRECSILCSLNKVDLDVHISNIGQAWFFVQCSRTVYDLNKEEHQINTLY